ncbi:hypothetical protein ACFVUH_22180 [Kitasatospora sp. NPDC058032]|uniref:allene oxide cyclase barrel-like domain-containing protein n=1 Tax=unclassified Kitasatospora TaxID=2633591 RepID=UPI0033B0275F
MSRTTATVRPARLAAFAVTVSSALVLAGPGVASAASPTGELASRGCVVFENLTDTVVALEMHDQGSPAIEVGDGATVHDVLTDAEGRSVGSLTGEMSIVFARQSDQHFIGYYREEIQLPGGSVRTAGLVDIAGSTAGVPQTVAAFGTSGRYRGKLGTRTYQLVAPNVYLTNIKVCG